MKSYQQANTEFNKYRDDETYLGFRDEPLGKIASANLYCYVTKYLIY
ncbi:hypothetical protein [Liquorilactobacillus mali]|nr:hypothetical protein [Liquorilactobacillus mali]